MYADVRHVFKQNINGMPKMTTITEITMKFIICP